MVECIIQARMGSSRLPGKTLMNLDDTKTTLDFVINQLSFSKFIDHIVIATTTLKQDDSIEQKAKMLGIDSFRGSETDVLDRYYECAKKFQMNTIVRITADCPLIDPFIVDKIIKEFQNKHCDYATNTISRTYPVGTDVEIFSFYSLEKSWNKAKLESEREHVTPFLKEKNSNFKIENIKHEKNLSHLRWTLDTKEDLTLIRKIISKINNRPILMSDILDLFSKEPQLISINKHLTKKGRKEFD